MCIPQAFKVQPSKEHVCKQTHAVINSEKEVSENWLDFCSQDLHAVEVLASKIIGTWKAHARDQLGDFPNLSYSKIRCIGLLQCSWR